MMIKKNKEKALQAQKAQQSGGQFDDTTGQAQFGDKTGGDGGKYNPNDGQPTNNTTSTKSSTGLSGAQYDKQMVNAGSGMTGQKDSSVPAGAQTLFGGGSGKQYSGGKNQEDFSGKRKDPGDYNKARQDILDKIKANSSGTGNTANPQDPNFYTGNVEIDQINTGHIPEGEALSLGQIKNPGAVDNLAFGDGGGSVGKLGSAANVTSSRSSESIQIEMAALQRQAQYDTASGRAAQQRLDQLNIQGVADATPEEQAALDLAEEERLAARGLGGTAESTEDAAALREQLETNRTTPTLSDAATQTATALGTNSNQFVDENSLQFQAEEQDKTTIQTYEAAKARMLTAEEAMNNELRGQGFVSPSTAAEYQAAKAEHVSMGAAVNSAVSRIAVGSNIETTDVVAEIQKLDDIDPRALAASLTPSLTNEATVAGNMEKLLDGMEGGEVPLWAQPAVDAMNAKLASQGMSTSSVGRNGLFNAIISAAMPMAQQDAKAQLAVFQQDISNEQQSVLANSKFFQTMTLTNLNHKQQATMLNATNAANAAIATGQNQTSASISNAQAFLQMDIANMSNSQQAKVLDAQLRQQTMLSNAGAENAARQFNAQTEQQASQFNTNLAASIAQFNATQQNTASQVNIGNDIKAQQFDTQVAAQREQFNVQNATAISQSNATWRRQMNQIDTASSNAVNQANAMNAFNLSNQALSFLWQETRDSAKWANDNIQNHEERKTRIAIASLGNESMADGQTADNIKDLANVAISIFDNWGT